MDSKELKILLIDPAFSTVGIGESGGEKLSNASIPLSVGYIGSYLKKNFPFLDIAILKASDEILEYISRKKPDIVGICNYLWNTNIAVRLSHHAREVNPNTFIVFGGPEINIQPVDRKSFIKKYSHADMLVHHEGELAFSNLIDIYIQESGKKDKIQSRIKELGNCFYINQSEEFIVGPAMKRIDDLNSIPSPYLMGLFDHFLEKGCYVPLVQTNRGCPYSCTFCQEGNAYYSKIHFHKLNNVKNELDYIAERVNPVMGLFIVDSNLGMYKEDIEVAYHLRDLKKKYNWPMHILSSTGKSQLPRIKKFAEILEGSLRISNAVQSLNNDVLDAIKRKNAATLEEFLKGLEMVSVPDIILPLPKETKKTFIEGLNKLLDTRSPIRFTVFHALLLSDTQMNDEKQVSEHGLKVKFRQHQNLISKVGGQWVCETERNIIQTSTMSELDVLQARKYVVILDAMLREEPLREIFYYLDSLNINRSKLTMSMYDNLEAAPKEIVDCLNDYIDKIVSETFDTEEEVLEYMKKYGEDYHYGIKGGDLLRYAQKLWVDHATSFLNWIFIHLNKVTKAYRVERNELNNLHEYYKQIYKERISNNINETYGKKDFDYDILLWIENSPSKKLSEFKKTVTYNFHQTNFSKYSKKQIWNSFGFNLDEDTDYKFLPQLRMYVSKMRRNVTRKDNKKINQRLSLAAQFAENVGLAK
tara:strand:+ start:127 stop:2226 length:2100 start_codon:yes stop_codon:yes gene_type:complete